MPRKTRKQKERARNRDAHSEHSRTVHTESGRGVNREFSFKLEDLKKSPVELESLERVDKSHASFNLILNRVDLIKSVVLALFVFSLELVIYWARLKTD